MAGKVSGATLLGACHVPEHLCDSLSSLSVL